MQAEDPQRIAGEALTIIEGESIFRGIAAGRCDMHLGTPTARAAGVSPICTMSQAAPLGRSARKAARSGARMIVFLPNLATFSRLFLIAS
jgi:hypothetical protein